MLFANACDSDVDDDNEPAEKEDEDDEEVAAAEPTATDEAEVDWNADEAAAWEGDSEEVAVVTMVGCPVFERNEELCNFDRSVLVLLAAVTSEASLPTRTVQGAEGDQWRTPKPFKKKKKWRNIFCILNCIFCLKYLLKILTKYTWPQISKQLQLLYI